MGVLALPAVQWAIVGLTAAGAVYANRQATGAQEVELEMQKRGERQAATDREIQRKQRLNAILGAQSAEAAAAGLSMEGSVANISIADARQAGRDSFVDEVNTRGRIDALTRQRKTITRLGNIRTATTILNAAGDLGSIGRTPRPNSAPRSGGRVGTGPA